jgi:hypothetical protein
MSKLRAIFQQRHLFRKRDASLKKVEVEVEVEVEIVDS